ncbi:MAG: DNA polymerase [Peptococcaceae bacterium BRH_c4b]|nr:MAG: DNA polymerase [Peptococcaceae bacterium BRH_c4b]
MTGQITLIEGRQVKLTNLEKLLWPEEYTKAHLIRYYLEMAPYILPHIHNRPVVMKRYPDGITGEYFYQKECPDYAPEWIRTHPVEHSEKTINYIVCNDSATLAWLANNACIEIHAWLAKTDDLARPDLAVIDLDPAEGASFRDTLDIALLARKALEEFGLESFPKTSGASGLHLFIPLEPSYSWQEVTGAMKYVAELIARIYPQKATIERKVERRPRGVVYIDYLQNGRGKTMAFQYGLRPLPGAPVSTPLLWEEIEKGDIMPVKFNLKTIFQRLDSMGDVYGRLLNLRQRLDSLLKTAKK